MDGYSNCDVCKRCMYVNILQDTLAERDVTIVDLEVTVSSYSVLIYIHLYTHF